MDKERPDNFDYSEALNEALDTEIDAQITDSLIEEIHLYIEELRHYRDETVKDDVIAKKLDLNYDSNLNEIDTSITEAEKSLKKIVEIKADFLSVHGKLKEIHETGKNLLSEYRTDKIN